MSEQVFPACTLDSLVAVDPEALPLGTDQRFAFHYVDISAAADGRLTIPNDTIEYRDAPSRARRVLRNGDVLMATVRPNLKAFAYCALPAGSFVASTGFAVLRAINGSDPQFILSAILSDDVGRQIERYVVGSNYPAINSSDVRRLRIPAFDPDEQRRIGQVIATIDEAIAQTEALIAKTQQIKAGLMHDLFTRGVTPDGQLRPPREEAPKLYKQTLVGWIPNDWEVSPARLLCSLITKGTTPPATAFATQERSVRFLRVDNLTFHGELDLSVPPLFIDARTNLDLLRRSILQPGDVLMNIVGPPLGKVGIVPPAEHQWNANQAIAIFRANSVSSNYLRDWLLSIPAQQWLSREAKQTSGQMNLTLKMCGDLPVAFPDLSEQLQIQRALFTTTQRLDCEADLLSKLRQTRLGLMHDLLTGRVRVPVADTKKTSTGKAPRA